MTKAVIVAKTLCSLIIQYSLRLVGTGLKPALSPPRLHLSAPAAEVNGRLANAAQDAFPRLSHFSIAPMPTVRAGLESRQDRSLYSDE
jgi:hypothetical protein